ncbi:MAG: hypothetical protein FJ284_07965 [Planctomycetes bacterium]|nr:hypothetical protein [Planctomycetota bacterium]
MRRGDSHWTWSAITFVIFTATLGTFVSRYVSRLADTLESNYGYVPNPEGTKEFLAELAEPRFAQAGRDCMENVKRVDTFLYRYADEAHRAVYGTPFVAWNQGSAGTCVSFGWGVGSYIGQAVDWKQGERPKPPLLVATEPIYGGSRTLGRMPPVTFGGWSDGSYGGAAARWVAGRCRDKEVGGILYREKVGEFDLSSYSIPLSRQWGAYGPPRDVAVAAAKTRAVAVAQVTTWDELAAAITSGYCVPVCSNVGFEATSTRDKFGALPRGGSWSHCMCVVAIRFASNHTDGTPDGALVLNSWGTSWVKGPRWPEDQPEGSFWASKADIEAILRQGDSFAIGGVAFEFRELNHLEWMQPAITKREIALNHSLAL